MVEVKGLLDFIAKHRHQLEVVAVGQVRPTAEWLPGRMLLIQPEQAFFVYINKTSESEPHLFTISPRLHIDDTRESFEVFLKKLCLFFSF